MPPYHLDGLGQGEAETRSLPWRPMGAGACLAAGGRRRPGGFEGFGPGPSPSQQRQLQGPILTQLAAPLMACAPSPPVRVISLER